MILLYDLLHLSYNLVYPAILGTFIYNMAAVAREPAPPWPVWLRQALTIALFSMDFSLAKKFYAHYTMALSCYRLLVAVLVEVLTILMLWRSFFDAGSARAYYRDLLIFVIGALVFYGFVLGAFLNREALLRTWPSLTVAVLAVIACIILVLRDWGRERVGTLVLAGLFVSFYVVCVNKDPVAGKPMLVTSELLGDTPERR